MNASALCCAAIFMLVFSTCTFAVEWFSGADLSMLPEIEKAGGVYRDAGKPSDAIQIFGSHGCNLYRFRLFVNPTTDFNKSWGATQDLKTVLTLSRRAKNAGGKILLDLHYSDTWADPAKQTIPADWKNLSFDQLLKKVHDYTLDVLQQMEKNGTPPDMVQIGNEIASGMIWPSGKLYDVPKELEKQQWNQFAQLLQSGIRAVREHQPDKSKTRIMLHIHGGGMQGVPTWFFNHIDDYQLDFDLIGLSFYPVSGESIDVLQHNISQLIETQNKDVIVAEVSYPWKQVDYADKHKDTTPWPFTTEGQAKFVTDLKSMLGKQKDNRAIGFIWWYPEAIPAGNLHIWRGGAEALFDEHGNALPALNAFQSK